LNILSLVEGFFATQVNFLVYTLVGSGCNPYPIFKKKEVNSLDDIEEIRLALKLKFLKRHGFGIVVGKPNITELRNSVAHLFYYIEEDATVRFGNQKVTKTDYKELYDNLRNVSFALHLVNLTYYRRFA
jgi:hypothetical protein